MLRNAHSVLPIEEKLNPQHADQNTYHADWLGSKYPMHYILCARSNPKGVLKQCIIASSGSAAKSDLKPGDSFQAFHDQTRRRFNGEFLVVQVVDMQNVSQLPVKRAIDFYTFK
jgi:hypothetical protein